MNDEKKKPTYWEDDNFETRAEDFGRMQLKYMTRRKRESFVREYYTTKYLAEFKKSKTERKVSEGLVEMDTELRGEMIIRKIRGV